jgi:hippurate hydrolase
VRPGKAQAGASFFDIEVIGQGSHGAMPQASRDPVVIGAGLVKAFQEIVSRNMDPTHPAVVSVTQFHAGSAYNVIPERATLRGTFRFFNDADGVLIDTRMRELCAGFAMMHGVEIAVDIRNIFSVLSNDPQRVDNLIDAAREVVGDKAQADAPLTMGSEDMADLLNIVPGAFFNLGHHGDVPLHNPGFIFDDTILPVGASLFARLVERRGAA